MTYIPQQLFSKTAFGELSTESKTPQVQLKFPYGVLTSLAHTEANVAGSAVTAASGSVIVTATGAASAYCALHSRDSLRYGPGQGAYFLGTGVFTTGVANSTQLLGAGGDDEGLFFGFNGTSFGVLHRSGGSCEIKSLTVTAGASGSGNITITLDGDAVTVAVTASDTIAEVVAKIVATEFSDAGRGWDTHTDDNVSVKFISFVAENAAGSFTFVDTDATSVTADAFAEDVAGVEPTDEWTAQTTWNIDKMDGTGPSGMTLDQAKGNVYTIKFQYLGYGAIEYFIEDSETGLPQLVHVIRYANTATVPSMVNPTLNLSVIVKTASGYSGGALVVKSGSLAGFIEGKESDRGIRQTSTGTKTVGTTETLLLVVHNALSFRGAVNKVSVYPDILSISTDGTKSCIFRIKHNPTEITGGVALTSVDTANSVMEESTTGTAVIGGSGDLTVSTGGAEGREINIPHEPIALRPGDRLTITAQHVSGAGGDATASISWLERL